MTAPKYHRHGMTFAISGLVLCMMVVGSCTEDSGPLAPYAPGSRYLSSLWMEDTVYHPRMTWLGGYVSVLGVNEGYEARLDSSLIWCVRLNEDEMRFPVTYHTVPPGAEDMTTTLGGTPRALLIEDRPYTFWVMKKVAWSLASAQKGKGMVVDSGVSEAGELVNDTLRFSPLSFTTLTDTTDRYINIRDVDPRGRLADLSILETDTSNRATIWFSIKQSGVTDSLVAAMGLVEDSPIYNVNNVLWEVLSVDSSSGTPLYRTTDVMGSPLLLGQTFPDTKTFFALPGDQLKRNKVYYFWLASKDWNGTSRDSRVASYYAWMVFETW